MIFSHDLNEIRFGISPLSIFPGVNVVNCSLFVKKGLRNVLLKCTIQFQYVGEHNMKRIF